MNAAKSRSLLLPAIRALSWVLDPIWRMVLAQRLHKGRETGTSVAQKCMMLPVERPDGCLIWGHAVGVGEVLALAGLFRQIGRRLPQASFLLTSSARSSGQALAGTGLPPRCVHQFAPIDTPRAVDRFLDEWRPDLGIWCEMDLWPVLLHATTERAIPRVLVNARLSESSFARRHRARALYRPLLQGFEAIWTIDQATAAWLERLGADPQRLSVTGTTKAISPPLGCDPAELQRWQEAVGHRPLWLFASSHVGEESLALAAHEILRRRHPDALLIIAPRYPARGEELAALCPRGSPRRSLDPQSLPGSSSVYVADTLGDLGLWYRLARVALIGGSFAPVGGHNPYEALTLGCVVLHGPQLFNFADSYRDLDSRGLARQVADPEDIARAVEDLWREPPDARQGPGLAVGFDAALDSLVGLATRQAPLSRPSSPSP
jgi:3-deoxy-D-manno-octulosonic-acid transferase